MSDVQSDMIERGNLLFVVFGSNPRRATFTFFSYFVAVESFTSDVGLLSPTGCVKTTPHKTFSRCETQQGIRVQVRNWIIWYSYNNWIVDTKCRVKIPTKCDVTWNIWEVCERSWCQCMSHHALKIVRLCVVSLSSLLSVSVVVLWLSSLFHARTLWVKFEFPFIP